MSPGLRIDGKAGVDGNLEIDNISYSPNGVKSGMGIYITGKIFFTAGATLTVRNIHSYGIYLDTYASMTNKGSMEFEDIGAPAIFNEKYVVNSGTIEMNLGQNANQLGIENYGEFVNLDTGNINIDGGGKAALYNISSNSLFENYGEINIENSSDNGIINYGDFINYSGGRVLLRLIGITAIHNGKSASYINFGSTNVPLTVKYAMVNMGLVENYDFLSLYATYTALRNDSSGEIINYEFFHTNAPTNDNSIINRGGIVNMESGKAFINRKCYLYSGSLLENYGFLTSAYNGSHSISGNADITNETALNDWHNSFGNSIDNQQVVSRPLTGTLQNGVPYPNALDVTSLNDVTIGTWKTAPSGGVSAGTYNVANNTFTPNASAIGLEVLYVGITNLHTGASQNARVYLNQPIQAMTGPSDTGHSEAEMTAKTILNLSEEDLKLYPNPTEGSFTIENSWGSAVLSEVKIFDNLGQLIHHENTGSGKKGMVTNGKMVIHLPSTIANGVYYVQCFNANGKIITERIVVERK